MTTIINPIIKLNKEDIKYLKSNKIDILPDMKRDDDLRKYQSNHINFRGNFYKKDVIIRNSVKKIEKYYDITKREIKYNNDFFFIMENVFGKTCTKNNQELIYNFKPNARDLKGTGKQARKIQNYQEELISCYENSVYYIWYKNDYNKGLELYEKSPEWGMYRRKYGDIKNKGVYSTLGYNIATGIERNKNKKENEKITSIPPMLFNSNLKSPKHFSNMENIHTGYCINDQISDFVELYKKFEISYYNNNINIEWWNSEIDKLIIKYEKFEKSSDLLKRSKLKSYPKYNDHERIRRNLYNPHCIRTGKVKCLVLDVDYDYTVYGDCMLKCIELLLEEIIHLTVRNKVPIVRKDYNCKKLNHCTIYIPFEEYHNLEEIKYLDDFFKFLSINDIGHTYYIGKNPGNLNLFDVYLSNSYSVKTKKRPYYIDKIFEEKNILVDLLKETAINYLKLFNRKEQIQEIILKEEINLKEILKSLYKSDEYYQTVRKYKGNKHNSIDLINFDNTKVFGKIVKNTNFRVYLKHFNNDNTERISKIINDEKAIKAERIKKENLTWSFKGYLGRYRQKLLAIKKESDKVKIYLKYDNQTLFKKDINLICHNKERQKIWLKIFYEHLPNNEIDKIKKDLLTDIYKVNISTLGKHIKNIKSVYRYRSDLITYKQTKNLEKRSENFVNDIIANLR